MRTITPLKLSKYLSSNLEDCTHALKQCHSIGKSLNTPTKRWLKAELIDKSYSFAFNQLDYVDEVGYDWTYRNRRVSGKSMASMFGKRNKLTREVLISNSYGASYEDVPEMFDDIILTQSAAPYSIAVASFEDVKKYMWCCEDGIKMQAPFEALDFIVHPDEGIDFEGMPVIDYNKKIDNAVDEMLLDVFCENTQEPCLT